jgi:hypothetical protein
MFGSDISSGWYGDFSLPFKQGDVISDFALPVFSYEKNKLRAISGTYSAVVVTQSCDIAKPSQVSLLLARVYPFAEVHAKGNHFAEPRFRTALREGATIAEFGLPPSGNVLGGEFMVVSFRDLFVVPKEYLESVSLDACLRLDSPYLEYFSQAFARFTMRVGLPHRLPEIPVPESTTA